MYLIIKILNRR